MSYEIFRDGLRIITDDDYDFKRVIQRFSREQSRSVEESREVLKDLVAFLDLSVKLSRLQDSAPDGAASLSLYPESMFMLRCQDHMDEMWHTFMLFSQSYDRFCRENYGEFLHHEPAKDDSGQDPVDDEELVRLVTFVVEVGGPELASRWYGH